MANDFKVVRVHFEVLEDFLNSLDVTYAEYYIYQILAEHSYDGALAVVILSKKVV